MNVPGVVIGLGVLFGLCLAIFVLETFRQAPFRSRSALPGPENHRLRSRLRRMTRPTLLLIPAKSPGFSKIGGLPELPPGVSWPEGDREPPAFVAQIDIATFRAHGDFDWLPESGRIYLFFDDDRNGAADCGMLLFSQMAPGPETTAPPGLPLNRRFAERRVGFMKFPSLPSSDWLGEDWASDDVEWEDFEDFKAYDFGDEIEHRIGGYPSELQNGQMAVACEYLWRGQTQNYREPVPESLRLAARQWRLLLQIDSDPALNMNWWDSGMIYVFVRARDAKRGDFSRTVTITQTH